MIVTDDEIDSFVNEAKLLPKSFNPSLKDRAGQNCFEQEVKGEAGHTFKIIVRQSKINPLDFSVILGVLTGGKWFRLKRYNGDSHEHTNKIEGEKMQGFHVHSATERYQNHGFREEGYAKKATTYSDWKTALGVMLRENNFKAAVDGSQKRLI